MGLFIDTGALQRVECCKSSRCRNRVAGERTRLLHVPLVTNSCLVKMLHDFVAAGNGGERIAATDDLSKRAHVGHDFVVALSTSVGVAEPCHDLIKNQRNAVLGCYSPQRLQEARLRRDEPLLRFDNDTSENISVGLDHLARCFGVIEGRDQHLIRQADGNAR